MYNTILYNKISFYIFEEKSMEVPFNFGKLVEGGQFINRESEILNLKQNIDSHINSILISPRRWGKSSLVSHVATKMGKRNKQLKFCFIDLFAIRGEEEFYQVLATELLKTTSTKWEDWVANGKKLFTRLIPRFQIGIDPINDFNVSFDWKELRKEGGEILNLPEKISKDKNIQVVVCIDEFQNIAHFDEPLVMQKKMRAAWQKHQISTYCLFGSKRHMLVDIFENKSMPFYKFGETIFLNKIDGKYWEKFIVKQFVKTNKKISKEHAMEIAKRMENHPYFVQLYASAVWKNTRTTCKMLTLNKALDELKLQYAIMFRRELDNLTNKQINFLIALVEGVTQFTSKETLNTYNLGSQGNIKRIKAALENKEVLDLWGNTMEFEDPLFRIWFIEDYLNNQSRFSS